jgi:2-succinyl-5-enolpyruvyl-6-hydroxy-3-cyclohexene-1-carboxylate synthase
MKMPAPNMNSLWARLLVEELIRSGTDYFCLAPGSRCTPLTIAVAENPKAKSVIHYDERGSAFHALGYARATGRPAVVVTTSGTAVANAWPAVVEAAMERIPLLLLTADRPPELRDSAANQTIDQVKIFGNYARWFVDLPCPSLRVPPEAVLTTVDQAVYRSCGATGGPVHINCMFREPLAPEPQGEDLNDYLRPVKSWLTAGRPYTEYASPERAADAAILEKLLELFEQTKRGLAVIGGLSTQQDRTAVSDLIQTLGWPACADVTSGLRLGDASGNVIHYSDLLVSHDAFARAHRPELVLHLGGRIVSKKLAAFLSESNPSDYVLITDHPERQDPGHKVTFRVEADLGVFCPALAEKVGDRKESPWLISWRESMEAVHKVLRQFAHNGDDLNEPVLAYLISRSILPNHGLFLASSMPVRHMDLFADTRSAAVYVGANRGASGVDGTMATATGFAAGLQRPVTLLIGDLAFLHDLNSLNYLRNAKYPVIAIVINNNGGGIFSFLSIARFDQFFEKYFVTPHDLTFQQAAGMYGLVYYHPKTRQEFLSCYQKALESEKSIILEVTTDRRENHGLHMKLVRDMQAALGS